jgi:hypothetical protein
LPDGLSGIFLREVLDRLLGDLPGGLICRSSGIEIALAGRRSTEERTFNEARDHNAP